MTHDSPSTRSRRQIRSSVEALESRQLLHATLQDGILTVIGTQFDDLFQITPLATDILVTHSTDSIVQTFEAFLVDHIVVNLGDGRDRIIVDSGIGKRMSIDGGAGNDRIIAGSGNDTINGGRGRDRINGGAGRDRLNGGRSIDQISGGADADVLSGGADDDQLSGGSGNDRLDGGTGGDRLSGGAGPRDVADYRRRQAGLNITIGDEEDNDGEADERDELLDDVEVILGGRADDLIVGDGQSQQLFGGAGNDTLNGGDGPDSLHGEAGNDLILANDGDKDFVNGAAAGGEDDSTGDRARVDDLDQLRGIDEILS